MISAHTPPGTRVVCIDDAFHDEWCKANVIGGGLDGLTCGETYTVDRIQLTDWDITGYEVVLVEISRPKIYIDDRDPSVCYHVPEGFCPKRFRRAELPSVLTDILKGLNVPIKESELVE